VSNSQTPSQSFRRLRSILWVLLPALLLLAAGWLYLVVDADWRLQAAVAEADRLDPEWRLAQLEAKQPALPDKDNSALQVLVVRKLIPQQWGGTPEFWQLFGDLPAEPQLNEQQLTALRAELAKAAKALPEARKLANMPRGRYPIEWAPDFYTTRFDQLQEARPVATLLQMDAWLCAQEGDADGAIRSVQGVLNTGRSIGDAPTAITQLMRIGLRTMAVRLLERTLAQGQPAPAVLADLQRRLEEEDTHPAFLTATRGERAGDDQLMEYLEGAGLSQAGIQKELDSIGPDGPSLSERLPLFLPGGIKRQRSAFLRFMTEAVEIAKLPSEQQKGPLDRWSAAARNQPVLVKAFAPALQKMATASKRSSAELRAAIVLLAAERYRQERKQLPESLTELVQAGYLKAVPTDPYDGKPLRFRRLDDGLVVYALGPDGQDNGGNLRHRNHGDLTGTDEGCRLWTPEKRRQAPLPPRAPEPGEGPGGPAGLPPP
jgi:hypothetical protein